MLVSKAFKQMRQNPLGTTGVPTAPLWTPFGSNGMRFSRSNAYTCIALASNAAPLTDAELVDMLQNPITYEVLRAKLALKDPASTNTGTLLGRAFTERGLEGLMLHMQPHANERIYSSVPIKCVYLFVLGTSSSSNWSLQEAQTVIRLDIEDLKYILDVPDMTAEELDIKNRPLRITHLKLS